MTYQQMYDELIKKMRAYHPSDDFSLIADVYEYAVLAHGDQKRKNGEPYMIHPMSVALILADVNSDMETIAAGILHDVVEDTDCAAEDITNRFGAEIAELVKGVTKLQNLNYVSKEEEQAENFRQLFLSMASDIRVILIKMADRLHNLQTLEHMSREHQIKKAEETIDIYAPLAHRLGIAKLRYQMEDLAFRYLKPDEYNDLIEKMDTRLSVRKRFIDDIITSIKTRFEQEGVEAKIIGRAKHLFSIYKKMVGKSKSLDEIYDILAVRIIVNNKEDCYLALGLVHDMYTPIPGRFKDYIAIPKTNNYQSLHTTALSFGKHFEVQIRTPEMDRIAEYGIAAHWKYKQRKGGIVDAKSEEEKFAWLRQIVEYMGDNREYLPALKDDLSIYKSHVYCFSPKGEVYSLLTGSSPIDFAYAVHSAVGNKMVGARVNGNIVPFGYELQNGDQVEIITSNNSRGPSMDWLNIVKTAQAKNKINQWFRKQNKEENITKGKALLEKEAQKKKTELHELTANKKWVEILCNRYGTNDWDSLCAAVGHGGLKEGAVIGRLIDERDKELREKELKENPIDAILKKAHTEGKAVSGGKSDIIIEGAGQLGLRMSKCCRPLPGDEIVAYVTRGSGVAIHRNDCVNILNLSQDDRARVKEAEWGQISENAKYRTDIRLKCEPKSGLITDISRIITELEGIRLIDFYVKNSTNDILVNISLEVKNAEQLEKVSVKLNNVPGVFEVARR